MKKYILLVTLPIMFFGIVFFLRQHQSDADYRIAILLPVEHKAMDEIIAGFKETLAQKLSCAFDVYNAHGDRVLLRTQAEHIVNEKYDLAMVVATQPAMIMREVLAQRGSALPVVATAVVEPVSHGIIASRHSSGNSLVTVIENQDIARYRQQLAALQRVFPVKKLLLVYGPNVTIDREKDLLVQTCHEAGITLTTIPVYAPHELAQKVGVAIAGHDAIIILKDTMVASCIEVLVAICARAAIPLYVSDLDSVAAGATFAYGEHERQFGIKTADLAYSILHDHQKPTEVESVSVDSYTFEINAKAAEKLKLNGVRHE